MDGSQAESSTAETAPGASASSPRYFWVGMAVFLIVIVFLGFGSTYGRQLVLGQEIGADGPYDDGLVATNWVIHLHAAVFVGWMLFLLAQTVLIARDRPQTHMRLGGYGGLGLGVAIVVVGAIITYVQVRAAVAAYSIPWADWSTHLLGSMESWFSLLGFAVLVGLFYRHRPAAHKRYMVFATIMLVAAATSRMEYLLGPWSNAIGMGLMVAPLVAYDLYTDGRVRMATLIGTGWVGALRLVAYL